MSTTNTQLDESRIEEFAGRLFEHYTGGMVTYMVDLGHRTGLFDVAAEGPASSAELAARAGLEERYVREWLGALATAGIFEYDAETGKFRLPAEHAACLTGSGNENLARFSQLNTHLAGHLGRVAAAFRHGGGVPYSEFRPEFTDVMDVISRNTFDDLLLDTYLPLVPGLSRRLSEGARVADLGCGTGHAAVLLAQAFPASTFVGYDLAADAIERARAEAASAGVDNARFEVGDIGHLDGDGPFHAIFAFDTVHDLVDPAGVLRAARDALVPGGIFLMAEPTVSSRLDENMDNPIAPWIYGLSTLHCLTVSLAEGGAGLGTAFGEHQALELLADAGFEDIEAHAIDGDPIDKAFIGRRPADGTTL
ncbi:MAG TPA: methyltransferase domain-containing protein [Arenicellales bacterium]|nr:methyltransferase domain-containing protein [Arenicellales bacterium]